MRYTSNEKIMENKQPLSSSLSQPYQGIYALMKEIESRSIDKIRRDNLRKTDGIHVA